MTDNLLEELEAFANDPNQFKGQQQPPKTDANAFKYDMDDVIATVNTGPSKQPKKNTTLVASASVPVNRMRDDKSETSTRSKLKEVSTLIGSGSKYTKYVELAEVDSHLEVIKDDDYLRHYENDIKLRIREFNKWMQIFQDAEGGLLNIARGYKKYGLQVQANGDIEYNEWAPGAKGLTIFGDFNHWNREEFRCQRNEFGTWSVKIPANPDGTPRIAHDSKYKINIEGPDGHRMDRNSAWSTYQKQDTNTNLFDSVFWNPPQRYQWKHPKPVKIEHQSVRIYESHVGMAQEFGRVSSYRDYADHNLQRVKDAGYNVIQLMAIQEHSYYASFGYHVTGFFGVSSRSGTPDDFKYLVDKAHGLGLKIIIDLVHSHASNNVNDGINRFDGTDHSFSHGGAKGYHSDWDSMLFDYSKYEVKRYLLSNLAWFLEEYKIDGFRFDAVTSILYQHHGIGVGFSGNYAEYFGLHTDLDGIVYLMLANCLIREINQEALTIAEDVSGMPTLCRSLKDGGIGFDYRLSMFMPDMWIKLMKTPDEGWNMGHIVHSLTNRRWKEGVVGYCESHDQAIVGDKTISMWLFDAEIYDGMSRLFAPSLTVSRGMALHKMIRLLSQSLGGEAYLNFMGNEFGHPEWIDFPREGNGWSYDHCRRQWNLLYDTNLRYGQLGAFDKVMNETEIQFKSMIKAHQYISTQDELAKLIIYEKGDLLFIFNFHNSNSYENYHVGTKWSSDHFVVFESDEDRFGGHQRLNDAHNRWYETKNEECWGRPHKIILYIPARTCIVMCAYECVVGVQGPVKGMPQPTDRQKQQVAHIESYFAQQQQPKVEPPKAQPEEVKQNPITYAASTPQFQAPQGMTPQQVDERIQQRTPQDPAKAKAMNKEVNDVEAKFKNLMDDFA